MTPTPTPIPPTPTAAFQTALTAGQTLVTGFKTGGITNFGLIIPVAAILLISVAIVYFVINHFRGMSHV